MSTAKCLPPIYTSLSKILILGSLPSEKSRESGRYYDQDDEGFWKVICDWLELSIPSSYDEKVKLLKDNNIAVWDMIDTCDIDGSNNSNIKNPIYNDIQDLLNKTEIKHILINGNDSFKTYEENFMSLPVRFTILPNASLCDRDANFDKNKWFDALWLVDYYCREDAVKHYVKLAKESNSPLYETIETDSGPAIRFDDAWLIPRAAVESSVTAKSLKAALLIAIEHGIL